jgi:hypothetical protein
MPPGIQRGPDQTWRPCHPGARPVPSRDKSRSSAPLVDVDPASGVERDRADVDVAVTNVPAVGAFGIAAAGVSGGHGPSKRRLASNRPRCRVTEPARTDSSRCAALRIRRNVLALTPRQQTRTSGLLRERAGSRQITGRAAVYRNGFWTFYRQDEFWADCCRGTKIGDGFLACAGAALSHHIPLEGCREDARIRLDEH